CPGRRRVLVSKRSPWVHGLPLRCSSYTDTSAAEICSLSLHDALPIWVIFALGCLVTGNSLSMELSPDIARLCNVVQDYPLPPTLDRKSTRLNSSHVSISYAGFGL